MVARYNGTAIAELLLRSGAEVNAIDHVSTPLMK